MLIVLDTSVIVPDFYFQGAILSALLKQCHRIPAEVGLSDVVRMELLVNYERKLRRVIDEVEKIPGCFRDHKSTVFSESQLQQLCLEYRKWVDQLLRIKSHRMPIPNVDHVQIIERMASLKKPFQEGGRGYKDFLIWMSVVEYLMGGDQIVCFVSENKKDFSDGAGGLHSDLRADLDLLGIHPSRVHYYESVKQCYDREVAPYLEKLDHIKDSLRSRNEPLDLEKWVYQNWESALSDYQFDPDDFLPDEGFTEGSVKGIKNVSLHDVFQVTRLSDDEIAIDFYVRATLDLELMRPLRMTGGGRGWRETDRISYPFEVNIIVSYDEQAKSVKTYEVAEVSPITPPPAP